MEKKNKHRRYILKIGAASALLLVLLFFAGVRDTAEVFGQGLNLQKISHNLAPYIDSSGKSHPIEIYRFTDLKTGQPAHFMLVLADNGRALTPPYPVIAVNLPYNLFPAPPSNDPVDVFWTEYAKSPPTYDLSLPESEEIRKCSTPRCPGHVKSTPLSALPPRADWALKSGYSVAFTFGRFYAARGFMSAPYEIVSVIEALKTLPTVDSNRIGLTGGSLGGFQTVYPLSRGDLPLTIAAAVALVPPVDLRAMENYYFSFLPTVQPPDLLQQTYNWVNPYFNRLYKSLGSSPSSSSWNVVTNAYVADNLRTPLLLISDTADAMVPVSETENLYSALKTRGKSVNKFVYQNGSPALSTQSVPAQGHGPLDQNGAFPITVDFLTKIFFVRYMPPGAGPVFLRNPGDVDMIAFLSEFRKEICRNPAELLNYSEIISYAANSRFSYISPDPRVISGSGPDFLAQAINIVWANEGISWTKDNVISNLLAGRLPTTCRKAAAPVLSSVSPVKIEIGTPVTLSFRGLNFINGAALAYRGPSDGDVPLRYVSSSELQLSVKLASDFPTGTYFVRIKNPDGLLSGELTVEVVPATLPSPPSCSLSFSPSSITAGGSSVAAWSSSGDSDDILPFSCSGDLGSGAVPSTGTTNVSPKESQSCTLSAQNNFGTRTCSASITVTPPAPLPPPPAPSCTASFSPSSGAPGTPVTASWTSQNDADGRIPYTCTGSWASGTLATPSGSLSGTVPNDSQSCTLTVVNSVGTSAQCSAQITATVPWSSSNDADDADGILPYNQGGAGEGE